MGHFTIQNRKVGSRSEISGGLNEELMRAALNLNAAQIPAHGTAFRRIRLGC